MKIYTVLLITILSVNIYSQNWLKVDTIFAVSGVTVKNFSAPEFADLNNDGKIDMILGNSSGVADFYWNNSNLFPTTFTKDTSLLWNIYSGGQINTNSAYPAFIDLDNDNDLDLIVGGYSGILYYENIGSISSPEFLKDTSVFANVNTQIGTDAQPAFVDIDGDGDYDLFAGIGESLLGGPTPGITLGFRNTGTPTNPQFVLDNTLVTGISDLGLNAYPTFIDLDNDEDFDLLFGRDASSLVYYKNTGTRLNPIWVNNSQVFSIVETTTYWKNPVFTDLDYDGDYDLVYGTAEGVLYVYVNVGTPAAPVFQPYTNYFKVIKINGNGATVSLADFDGDGDNDLLSGIWTGKFIYFKNDGTFSKPVFNQAAASFSNLTVGSYSSPVFVDIDKDNDFDIVSGALNGQVYLFINNNGTFVQNSTMFSSIDVGSMSIPSFADLDGDGDLDLLVGADASSMIKYYKNNGSNVFQESPSTISGINFENYSRPALSDIDNDGDYDLIIGDSWGEVFYYKNDGIPNIPVWVNADSLFLGIAVKQNAHPGFADLDGDGRKDMILGEYNGNFTFYKNLFSPLTIVEDEYSTNTVKDFILEQNYPNPFNPATTISYRLRDTGNVELKVYNILGKEIAVLVDEVKTVGLYKVEFNAKGLSSGVYFYTLRVNGISYSKSMILLK